MAVQSLPSGRKRLWRAPKVTIYPAEIATCPRRSDPLQVHQNASMHGNGNCLEAASLRARKPLLSVHQNRHEKRVGEAGGKACIEGWQFHWR